jgi:hypothetical protein
MELGHKRNLSLAENACSLAGLESRGSRFQVPVRNGNSAMKQFFGPRPFGYRQVSLSCIFDLYVTVSTVTVFTKAHYWTHSYILPMPTI